MSGSGTDVLICGGGVVGSATAYYLTALGFPGRVTVVEPNPGYARAATALSAGGIRQQFSNPLNMRISAFGVEVIRDFPRIAGRDLHFHEHGYLTLAATAAQAETLRANHAVQRAEGAQVDLLDPAALQARFPHLEVADLALAAFGARGEGWFDNMGLLQGFRALARAAGVGYLRDEVTALDRAPGRVTAAHLASGGRLACGQFVNAAGGRGAEVAAMAGIALPVERRKRTIFALTAANPPQGRLPLMIDPSGVWCRPEGAGFIAGCTPDPDPSVSPDDFEPRHREFEAKVWPVLAARSRAFEAIKLRRFWAGHYDMNILDRNAIVGPHPEIGNFHFANGFSGHGLQQAPAVGRGLAELIACGAYRTLDLAPFGFARVAGDRPCLERAVI